MQKQKYISGKILGLTEEDYKKAFKKGCDLVRKAGYEPLNPLNIGACKTENCNTDPHRLPQSDGSYLHSWECYLKNDIIAMLRHCDGIVMLPNWPTSNSARLEMLIASKCGLSVSVIDDEYEGMHPYYGQPSV